MDFKNFTWKTILSELVRNIKDHNMSWEGRVVPILATTRTDPILLGEVQSPKLKARVGFHLILTFQKHPTPLEKNMANPYKEDGPNSL